VLREVIADELERLGDEDERLRLTTVTGVETEPDLRHATVFVDSLSEARRAGLDGHRVRLQAAIARQVRLKRTPRLSFEPDPAVASGERVDSVLRRLHQPDQFDQDAATDEDDQDA
jgi:ribosome-binding factor A